MRSICLFLFLAVSVLLAAQDNLSAIIKEGVALHDRGKYEDAIRKYDEVIAKDSKNLLALYEKTYSLLMLKKYEECARLCEFIVDNFPKDDNVRNAYLNWGSALDYDGKSKAALKVYNKGLKDFPGYYLLYFNKAITYIGMNELEDATTEIINALEHNPLHASSHNVLATLVRNDNKVASLLSSLTYLALQPYNTERATFNRQRVEKILSANVTRQDEKNTTITLSMPDTKAKRKDNDFSAVEMAMSLSSALNGTDKYKDETPVQQLLRNLEMVFSSLSVGLKDGKGFFWKFYAPFFVQLNKENRQEVLAHLVYATSGNVLNEVWMQDNQKAIAEFNDWVMAYEWKAVE